MSARLQTAPTLGRTEARFYERPRAWAGRSNPLGFIWQVLDTRPAVAGPEPQLWLVPSATRDDQNYLVNIAARCRVCDGFHFRHACPHLEAADRAARLLIPLLVR